MNRKLMAPIPPVTLFVQFSLLTFFVLNLVGCAARPVHYADGQNVPLFEKSGQAQAHLGYQFEKGLQAQTAVAVSPQFALHLGGAYSERDNCHSCSKDVTRHIDLGLETYRKLDNGYLQGFIIGGGLGRFKAFGKNAKWDPAPEDIFVSHSQYHEFFLQGHQGKRGPIFEQAGSLRLSGFRFYDFHAWDGNEKPLDYANRQWGLYLEPAYTVRVGYKAVKLQCQSGISLPLYQSKDFNNSKIWLNFGVTSRLFLPSWR